MLVLCQLGAAKGILSNLPAEVFAHIQVSWLWVGYRICCKLLTKCVHDFFTIAPTACVILIEFPKMIRSCEDELPVVAIANKKRVIAS